MRRQCSYQRKNVEYLRLLQLLPRPIDVVKIVEGMALRWLTNLIDAALDDKPSFACGYKLLKYFLEILGNLFEGPLDSLILTHVQNLN